MRTVNKLREVKRVTEKSMLSVKRRDRKTKKLLLAMNDC